MLRSSRTRAATAAMHHGGHPGLRHAHHMPLGTADPAQPIQHSRSSTSHRTPSLRQTAQRTLSLGMDSSKPSSPVYLRQHRTACIHKTMAAPRTPPCCLLQAAAAATVQGEQRRRPSSALPAAVHPAGCDARHCKPLCASAGGSPGACEEGGHPLDVQLAEVREVDLVQVSVHEFLHANRAKKGCRWCCAQWPILPKC